MMDIRARAIAWAEEHIHLTEGWQLTRVDILEDPAAVVLTWQMDKDPGLPFIDAFVDIFELTDGPLTPDEHWQTVPRASIHDLLPTQEHP